ncbi:unnamed protein product (macronuclear) [Paramecium tetraurelia]|uniref:Uncharacterized protein n=1 Tax=Paramecium tetraurelia TaxID=5888 RepID=A0CE10_PARTE|nr:uncharacterized protein GSPATT00007239001 [Paramecium tetraurelia]CAK69027.1 unnamed protein product [Paramecium tetraurelia]|eukprot:XP_001436424.1 hypothetical protein (macronuclear) [Paramecium tetraurelia strain d4-2]
MNSKVIINQNTLRDVEMVYEKAIRMISCLKEKHKLITRIRLVDSDKAIFQELAKGMAQLIDNLRKGGDVHLIFQSNLPYFEVQLDLELFIVEPKKMKECLLRKQLRELGLKNIQFKSKECREHIIADDFINLEDEFKKDECAELLKERFDTFKVQDEQAIIEILKKYLKKNLIETYNRELIDIRFYINQDFDIVIEYKINDNQLNLQKKIKRRRWSEIKDAISHFYTYQYLQEITLSMMEQMFYVDEIELMELRQCVQQIVQNCQSSYNENLKYPLSIYKSRFWDILGILPRSLNTHNRFGQCKIIIIQNQSRLFFLNHQKIIENKLIKNDITLFQTYTQLIADSKQRLDLIKKNVSSSNTQSLIKQKRELIEKLLILPELEQEIQGLQILEQWKLNQSNQDNEEDFILQMPEETYDQIKAITDKIAQTKQIYEEYHRVLNKVKNDVINFQGFKTIQQNKIYLTNLYKRVLQEKQRVTQKLPIYFKKRELIDSIQQSQVILLIGATGSGKSTQLVQYVYEEIELRGKIICVEPRMIAARSLAKRVAEEMHTKLGGSVAYLNEYDQLDDDNKIIFTQDRIILNILQKDPLLNDYEVVIIDEAHERNMNTDILLGLLKDIINKRKDLKIIIMSATMDEELFSNYFQCKAFKVEGKLFDVKIKYQNSYSDNYIDQIQSLIQNKIIYKVMNQSYQQRHVLIFLAGIDEIQRLLYLFQDYQDMDEFLFLGLHGQMTQDEQFDVFQETKKIKIIFSTRVAETALTINDVSVVIDIGVDRFSEYDQKRGMQITKISWISQAQANQRAGRAGRTRQGKCYRLYSEQEYQTQMQEHKTPEIQRCCLDLVVLRIKSFNKDPFEFEFIQSPNRQAMKSSQEYLIDIKALDEQGNITVLGKFMSQIQTEPRMSRILIEAYYKNVFRETLSIICVMLNNQSLYLKNTDVSNKIECLNEMGDFFTYSRVYWDFKSLTNSNLSNFQIKQKCFQKGYHYKTLKNCEKAFDEMEKAFSYFDLQLYENQEIKNKILWNSDSTREECVMTCFLTAFYPDLCVYNGNPYIGYTFLKSKRNVRIYGSSTLSLLNHFPKYIICSDLYSSNYFDFCRVAQEVKLEKLKEILKPSQIEEIENFVPDKYQYQQLRNVSSSLLNHLIHTFNQYSYDEQEKRFQYYCNNDQDNGIFEIWSLKPIDLEFYQKDYYEKMKSYLYFRLYGQGMLVYFKHGAQIHVTQQCTSSELVIVQFSSSPFNIEEIQQILDEQHLYYNNLFQINANRFGYCGQIFTNSQEIAYQITYVLNEKAKYRLELQNQQEQQERQRLFTIKPREIRNRVIKSSVELIFYGSENKGFGFIQFKNQEEAEEFFIKTISIVQFKGRPQDLKIYQDQKSKIRISNVPYNANEYELLRYLQDLAQQKNCPKPQSLNLIGKEQTETKDWNHEIHKVFEKYTGEKPLHLDIRSDKNNYRIIVRVMTTTNPIKLEEMRKQINFTNNILGFSSITMKIEYKIIKIISKNILVQNEEKINDIKKELQAKYSEDLLKIFSSGENMIIIGKNPNFVRQASLMLHGVLNGYNLKVNLRKYVFKQVLRDNQFYQDLLSLQDLHGFKFNTKLLQQGAIKVYLNQDSLIEIQNAINSMIKQHVSNNLIVNIRNYSFKPLLTIKDNIMFMLQQKYNVSIDFILQKKQIIIYGNNEQAQKCKDHLLKSLSKSPEAQKQDLCEICYGELTEKYVLALCNHFFCKNCLYESIKAQNNPPYKCPQQSCDNLISLSDLQQILCEIEFSKLLDQSFKRYKDQHADEYIGCLTPDCEEFFKKLTQNKEQFYYCQSCLQSFCFLCKRNAHPQISCEEAKKLFIDGKDLDESELLKMNIKRCPKCQMGVQKNEGCLHLHCTNCENHFCWVCLHQANLSQDIYAHLRSQHGGYFQ